MSDWRLTEDDRRVLQRALEIVSSTPPEDGLARSDGSARSGEGLARTVDTRARADESLSGIEDIRGRTNGSGFAVSSGGPSNRNGTRGRFNPAFNARRRSVGTPLRASFNLRSRRGAGKAVL